MKSCTFCGEEVLYENISSMSAKVMDTLTELIKNGYDTFYSGLRTEFDRMCLLAVDTLKYSYPHITNILVSPYPEHVNPSYLFKQDSNRSDKIIYPQVHERVQYNLAVSLRDQWMIDNSDKLVTYLTRKMGLGYKACVYASIQAKDIIHLGSLTIE